MKKIPLTQGQYAIVDDEEYNRVNQGSKWFAMHDRQIDVYYAVRNIRKANSKRTTQRMHRFIMSCPTDKQIDHRNHDTLDNRKCNLRLVTNSQNSMNSNKCCKKTASRYKGVTLAKIKYKNTIYEYWESQIKINGKKIYLGVFKNEVVAGLAYNKKAKELFGEYALLNKIDELELKNDEPKMS